MASTTFHAPDHHVDLDTTKAAVRPDAVAADVPKPVKPIINPVLGFFLFLAMVVAANLALDGLNYAFHLIGL